MSLMNGALFLHHVSIIRNVTYQLNWRQAMQQTGEGAAYII
jgi:hypothetical protein